MEFLLVFAIPAILLLVAIVLLSRNQGQLRQKLFSFELSGRSSQVWNFGVIVIVTVSMIAFFFKR